MGRRRSSSTTIVKTNTKKVEKQNRAVLKSFKAESARQRRQISMLTRQLQDIQKSSALSQREQLSATQLAARDEELRARAAGTGDQLAALDAQSLQAQQQRLRERQNDTAMNQSDRAAASAAESRNTALSSLLRRRARVA